MLLIGSSAVYAGSRLTDFLSTCTTANCSAVVVTSTYGHDQFSNADPSIWQVFTAGNECVRIAVSSQGTDLEATLTCPSGRTWQNDDGNGSLRPLIKALTPSARGWCTLTFSHFTGEGVANDFVFSYGRYPSTNVNCAGATPGVFLTNNANGVAADEDEETKDESGGDRDPRVGGSGDVSK